MTLSVGTCLGPYEVVGKLGAGGMGEVYRARDSRLKREVALKILPAELQQDGKFKQRFEREAQTISLLQHPNVCTLYDVGSEGDIDYLVMELLQGETLEARLRRGPLPAANVLEIGAEIAEAVAAAHDRGVVHRDLKPGNVMLTEAGSKVLDFGLAIERPTLDSAVATQAVTAQAITDEGTVLGTMPYMAPEQVEGNSADSRTDIWALGCIVYEMVTGERPFHGDTEAGLIGAILKDEVRPPSRKQPLSPPSLDSVVKRCLEKAPDRRWQSAADLAYELRTLGEEPTRAPDGLYKNRWWVLAALLVLLVVGVGWLTGRKPKGDATAASSVANEPLMLVVLPFENLGPDEQAFFAAGMADEITNRLSKLGTLAVISSSSAVQFANAGTTIEELANEGIHYLVSGSVLWAGDRVRITPELVRTADETRLWGERYDEVITVENLIDVQAEIAEQVSRELDLKLLASLGRSRPTSNMEAYTAYLRGLEAESRPGWEFEDGRDAVDMFRRAVELDPEFTLAWSKLSESHAHIFDRGYDRSPERAAAARRAIERAVSLEPDLPETRRALGRFYYDVERDYEKALPEMEAAFEKFPNDGKMMAEIGWINARRDGGFEKLVDLCEKAANLDPSSSDRAFSLGLALMQARQYERADQTLLRAVALSPDNRTAGGLRFWNARLWKGWEGWEEMVREQPMMDPQGDYWWFWYHVRRRDWQGAQREVDLMRAEGPIDQSMYVPRDLFQAWLHSALDEHELARASYESARVRLESLLEERPEDYRLEHSLAFVYAGLGDKSQAIRHAERNVALLPVSEDALEGPTRLWGLAMVYARLGDAEAASDVMARVFSLPGQLSVALMESDPHFDGIREHPRYLEVVEAFRLGE